MQKPVKAVHAAARDDIADLMTYRPLPNPNLPQIDPFLFLNHHGLQTYGPHNKGLPFGPHPHRGFETVTIILKGDIAHRDSSGHESVITAGGVQWMTAGQGLVHSETSSQQFKDQGGELEVLQLWVNLPSHLKMTEPKYVGLQERELTHIDMPGGRVDLFAGEISGKRGPFKTLIDIELMTVELKTQMQFSVPPARSVFFYVVRGELTVNGIAVKPRSLVEFAYEGDLIQLQTQTSATVLFGHALPLQEPVVAYGPFVMNTREEIMQAIQDYQQGKFGGTSANMG